MNLAIKTRFLEDFSLALGSRHVVRHWPPGSFVKQPIADEAAVQFMLFNDLALIYWTFYGVIAVAITPNLIGAAVISGAFYGLSNLFAGLTALPRPQQSSSRALERNVAAIHLACLP